MYHSKETVTGPTAEICERIWLSIAEKRLRPGARLKEEQLAEIFDVSRARVRQALAVLESDGLVTIVPNRGAFVSEPGVDEARDVFHVRKQIEARVLERLIDRISDEEISLLDAHLTQEREADQRGIIGQASLNDVRELIEELKRTRPDLRFIKGLARVHGDDESMAVMPAHIAVVTPREFARELRQGRHVQTVRGGIHIDGQTHHV